MGMLADSSRLFFLAQFVYRATPWIMFMAEGTYYAGPWPVHTPDQTPGLGLTSPTVPRNRTCPSHHTGDPSFGPGLSANKHEWFKYEQCPPGGLCDMADDMAKMMTLDQVDLLGSMLVIPFLLSPSDVLRLVPWAGLAIVPQLLSFVWVAAQGDMSPESKLINLSGYTLLVLWAVGITRANGSKRTGFPPALAQINPMKGPLKLCKKYLVFEQCLLSTFAVCFAIPPLAAGILGGIAEDKNMPCFEVNACPNVDRLCHAAHAISKVYAGSCLHWSLYYPGVMTLSRDGVLKMTFWIALLWMLDVYPGWIVAYFKASYGPNLTGVLICFTLWGFIAPIYPWWAVWTENKRSAIPRPLSFFFTPAQQDEEANIALADAGGINAEKRPLIA